MPRDPRTPKEKAELHVRRILEAFGYPYSSALIYAKLLLAGEPKSIDDLVEETGLGKSTVSTSLRMLEHDGLVYWEKMGRRKLFHARSALVQLLLLPTRLLDEEILPLRRALSEAGDISDAVRERLLGELEKFEEIARAIEGVARKYAREARELG